MAKGMIILIMKDKPKAMPMHDERMEEGYDSVQTKVMAEKLQELKVKHMQRIMLEIIGD